MSERGYITIARGILDHPVVGAKKPYSHLETWQWLLLEAAWKPHRVPISNGRTRCVLSLDRGQLSYSLRFMASKWGWSVKRVRTFLDRLEPDQMVTTQTGTGQTLITISNYSTYQLLAHSGETQTDTQTGTQRARKGHKEEKGNKGIEDNTRSRARADEPEGFAEWYDAYPRKKQRRAAVRAYRKIVPKRITHAELLTRTAAYAQFHLINTPRDRWQFVPYPASWLNSGEYLDQPSDKPANSGDRQTAIEPPTRDPKTFTDAEWRERLADYRGGQSWPDLYWGPAPGSPGCLVPAKLIIERTPPKPLLVEGVR
jgi:hypothetical protein